MRTRLAFPLSGSRTRLWSCGSLSITIQNPSFETATLPLSAGTGIWRKLIPGSSIYRLAGDLAGWTGSSTTANSAAGAFDPTSGGNNWTTSWWAGNNIGLLQTTSAGAVSLFQTLPTVTLSVLLRVLGVPAVDANVIRNGMLLAWPDFEDAVIAAAAEGAGCDAIVTRDPKGFPGWPFGVVSPEVAAALLTADTI